MAELIGVGFQALGMGLQYKTKTPSSPWSLNTRWALLGLFLGSVLIIVFTVIVVETTSSSGARVAPATTLRATDEH